MTKPLGGTIGLTDFNSTISGQGESDIFLDFLFFKMSTDFDLLKRIKNKIYLK